MVALRTGVNAIVTESNKYSYFYLTQRLLLECGSLILSEENKKNFWQKVLSYWSSQSKENVLEQERVQYLVDKLANSGSFKGVNQHAITQIIQSMSSELSDLKSVPDSSLVKRALEHVQEMKSSSSIGSGFLETLVPAPPSPKAKTIMQQLNLPEFEDEKDAETFELESQIAQDGQGSLEQSGQMFDFMYLLNIFFSTFEDTSLSI